VVGRRRRENSEQCGSMLCKFLAAEQGLGVEMPGEDASVGSLNRGALLAAVASSLHHL
jgi:hypothetical protein